jgi:hypothetical protein
MSEADLAQLDKLDASVAPSKAAAVLASHVQKMKLDRELDPARFQPKQTSAAGTKGGRKSSGVEQAPPIQFKEVSVRQVDDKGALLQLRANHVYQQPIRSSAAAPASPTRGAPDAAPTAAAAAAAAGPAPGSGASVPASQPVIPLLNYALISALGGPDSEASQCILAAAQSFSDSDSSSKEPIIAYFHTVLSTFPDEQNAYIIAALAAATTTPLVESSLVNPKEFWVISGLLLELLQRITEHSQAFQQTFAWLYSLGRALVARESSTAVALFLDFAFPKYLAVLRDAPTKIDSVAHLAYAFVAEKPEEHLRILKALNAALVPVHAQTGAPGVETEATSHRLLYTILAALAPYEGALIGGNGGGAIFQAYNTIVKASFRPAVAASQRTKGTALSVFAPLAANPHLPPRQVEGILEIVKVLVPHGGLDAEAQKRRAAAAAQQQGTAQEEKENSVSGGGEKPLAASPHTSGRGLQGHEWVLDASLLHILGCLLLHPWVLNTPDALREVHLCIDVLLGHADSTPLPTLRAGLGHLVGLLGAHPAVRKSWLRALLEDDAVRTRLLHPHEAAEAAEAARDVELALLIDQFCLENRPLRELWHPLTVAQSLADHVRVAKLDNLSLSHIDLLACCVEDAFGGENRTAFPDSETAEWNRLFLQLRDHLVVELCDPSLSESVVGILRRFLFDPRTSMTAQSIFVPSDNGAPPPLYCIMRFMFPDAADESQINTAGFLEELAQIPAFVELVHKNIKVREQRRSRRKERRNFVGEILTQHAD